MANGIANRLESSKTQPAQPPSGRIAHLFPRIFVCFAFKMNFSRFGHLI
ncbi:MAG: hypothetical protein LBK82_02445 [Planctomycetaceae bacterium]|nr:hypothetical protein [Planctomycetaceae bacterium]